ncbi:helix-turn-helix domain-containing protein [Brevibacterium aurantiacum]|uniref:Helix-turn-helix domain-containing protein n=2 Tax=Brevibacterium aurantiacum TaxID=273384 RepID=A0A556CMB6_BREAU|nr:helix-turn-helix domain-containing protein [Brevibacterium aurantiacum]
MAQSASLSPESVKKSEPYMSGNDASQALAESIKKLRTSQKMTQRGLASRAQLSTSFISQLERGNTDVTFSTLTRLCAALGTTIGHLFPADQPNGRIVRFDEYRHLDYNGVDKYVLTREEMADVDVCLFDFPPGSSTGTRVPPGVDRTELWICLTEYLGIDIGSDVHFLKAGDSLDFASDRTNTVYNPGPNSSRALLVIKNHKK